MAVLSEDEWAERTKRLLRTEMVRHGVTYEGLAERLATLGVHDTPVNLRNKVARGRFAAMFFVQCLEALGCRALSLDA
jgi:hypothetical protein